MLLTQTEMIDARGVKDLLCNPRYLPAYPKPASMWERWAFSPTAKECNAVVEPPWWERHGIADPASCTRQLQEIAALDRDGVWRLK